MSTQAQPLAARRWLGVPMASLADGTAFGVLLASVVAIPVTFSIANPDVFAMPKTIVAVGLAVLLGILLGVRWIATGARLRDLRRNPLAWAVTAFVAWNLVAYALALRPEHALIGHRLQYQGLGTTLAYVVYLVAAATTVRSGWRWTMLLVGVVLGATVVAGYALLQGADLDPIWTNWDPGDRAFSTIGQANALAAYLVIAIFLTLGLVPRRSLVVQALLVWLVAFQTAALALTLSRGGFVGAGVAAMVFATALVWRRRQLSARRGGMLLTLTALPLIAGIILVPGAQAGVERTVDRAVLTADLAETSTRMRLDLWAVGLAIAVDHPIVGRGQDSYVLVFHDYRRQVLPPDRSDLLRPRDPESPHNHYLAIAGGAGFPALAAYLAVVLAAASLAIRAMRATTSARTWMLGAVLLAAIAGHLVTDAFMTAETTGSVLFWIVLGAAAALGHGGGPAATTGVARGVD